MKNSWQKSFLSIYHIYLFFCIIIRMGFLFLNYENKMAQKIIIIYYLNTHDSISLFKIMATLSISSLVNINALANRSYERDIYFYSIY